MMKRGLLAICAVTGWLALAPLTAPCSETLRGRVVAVLDGDTLTVLDIGHRQHRIRLHQIDAPEHAQDYGARSKQSLAQLVAGREVTVEQVDTDRYGRIVGTVWAAGQDINLAQVRAGMAWVYRQYGKDPAYLAAEAGAKRSRIGLWSQPRPIPPWTFRHQQSDSEHQAPPRRRGGWF